MNYVNNQYNQSDLIEYIFCLTMGDMMSDPDDEIVNVLGQFMPDTILLELFSKFLSLANISQFDVAICNIKRRIPYLELIGSESYIILADEDRDFDSAAIFWLKTRLIKIRHLKCSCITDDLGIEISSFGS
jgi:hypothetical protein